MAVQILTPPDNSAALSAAIAMRQQNSRRGPDVSIGGMDPIRAFEAWSNRDISKQQIEVQKAETAAATERAKINAKAQTDSASIQKEAVLGLPNAQMLATQRARELNEQDEINNALRPGETPDMLGGSRAEQIAAARQRVAMRAIDDRFEQMYATQKRTEILMNTTPQTVANTMQAAGIGNYVDYDRLNGADPNYTPKNFKGEALLDGFVPGAPSGVAGVPMGANRIDEIVKKHGPLANSVSMLPESVTEALTKSGFQQTVAEWNRNTFVGGGMVDAAEVARNLNELLQDPSQRMGYLLEATKHTLDFADNISTVDRAAVTHGMTAASTLAAMTPSLVSNPSAVDSLDGAGLLTSFGAHAPEFGKMMEAWRQGPGAPPGPDAGPETYQSAGLSSLSAKLGLQAIQSSLRLQAAQLAAFGSTKPAAAKLASKFTEAAGLLDDPIARHTGVANLYLQNGVTNAALQKIIGTSMKDGVTSGKPGILAGPVTEAMGAGMAGLGNDLSDITTDQMLNGRQVNMGFIQSLPKSLRESGFARGVMNMLTGDDPEYNVDPQKLGMSRKAPDYSAVKHALTQTQYPINGKLAQQTYSDWINAKFAGQKAQVAKALHKRRDMEARMKLPPRQQGSGGSSQPASPKQPQQPSQPKKPQSGGSNQ